MSINKNIPRYRKIYEELKDEILSGRYSADDFFPPERVLKERFEVSHLTVRKALSLLVEENLIRRESGCGTKVIYQHDEPFQQVMREVTALNFLVERADDFFSNIINRLETACRLRSIRFSLYCLHSDPDLHESQFARAAADPKAVIVYSPCLRNFNKLKFNPALARTIILDETAPGLDVPQVVSADVDGMYSLTDYLASLGHRVIAHVSAENKTSGLNRLAGYRRAVERHGLANRDSLVACGNYTTEQSYHAFRGIMDKNPDCTACVCANDYSAFGVMRALNEMELEPGRDFSLAGYGNYEISEVLGLTSVDQQPDLLCDQIVHSLDRYIATGVMPRDVYTIPVDLKLRTSCGPVRV